MDKNFDKKINAFSEFDFNSTDKYEIYITSRYNNWIEKYNEILFQKNKNSLSKTWKRKAITNHELTYKSMKLIFNSKDKIATDEEKAKYLFIVLSRSFSLLYKGNNDINHLFKMFFWIKQTDIVEDFMKRVKKFN